MLAVRFAEHSRHFTDACANSPERFGMTPLKLFDNFAILPLEIIKVRKVFADLTRSSLSIDGCIPYRYAS
jgi:hypothetical protein